MKHKKGKALMLASVASMIDQFNMPNIHLMQELGYEVHVACNFKEGNTCDEKRLGKLRRMLQDMEVIWHQWDCPRNVYPIKKCCKAYWQLWKLTEQYHFAWMHCHSPIGGALARLVAHQKKIWVVYTAHGFHFYPGAPFWSWMLYYPAEALLARWTDELVTVNQEDFRFAKQHFKAGAIYCIPGVGIDTRQFQTSCQDSRGSGKKEFCRKYRIPEDARILLSVGELNRGKNHRMVIDAMAALPRQDVYYLICGQGPLRNRLKRYADRCGVGSRIRMPGYQENMPWIYQNTDIFVFPSMREGMPAALMEAMASGLPCVVSDIRGNRELIHDAVGNSIRTGEAPLFQKPGGMRFSLEQPGQLAKALEMLLNDGCLRQECGMYNKKKIRGYDQTAVQKRMKKIYADCQASSTVPD